MDGMKNPAYFKRDKFSKAGITLINELVNHGLVERGAIAGSVRRNRPDPKDLEIVVIPVYFQNQATLLGGALTSGKTVLEKYIRARPDIFKIFKAGPKYMKLLYTTKSGDDIPLDLFIANRKNWGLIYMIRTGSDQFSKSMMVRLHQNGLRSEGGHVQSLRTLQIIPVPEEGEFFKLVKLPFIKPNKREGGYWK